MDSYLSIYNKERKNAHEASAGPANSEGHSVITCYLCCTDIVVYLYLTENNDQNNSTPDFTP